MGKKTIIEVPVNRVEGDLEVRVRIEDGVVTDAWSSGLMYRGFERILQGRGPLDGLVITPRICGICTTAHLTAAAKALDNISDSTPPPNALRVRNIALMTEYLQSDMRHGFLMFTVDFLNPAYRQHILYDEAVDRYEPLKGRITRQVIDETKNFQKIIAILGGQWPHSSYMIPGGVVCTPNKRDMLHCHLLLKKFRNWYETVVLGCKIERWKAVKTMSDLDDWLEENPKHREGELGFFIRYARHIGLDKIGKGHGNLISYGCFPIPEDYEITDNNAKRLLFPSGFARGADIQVFNQEKITEHVAYSWFKDYTGGRHPFEGETEPYATGEEDRKYSWAKAPRYNDLPAETGPLAQMIMFKNPLFVNYIRSQGPDVFIRELARLVRAVDILPAMEQWIAETETDKKFYLSFGNIISGQGYGLTDVTRGALGHWVSVKDGRIQDYQIITPTAWNASPRDAGHVRGPWEEALIGTSIKNESDPVEIGHIIRSFDACLVCTVH